MPKEKSKPYHGQPVSVSEKLVRYSEFRKRPKDENSRDKWKVWKRQEYISEGILLGIRTLRNGIISWEHEIGNTFYCKDSFQAALVSPGPSENPIYVPLDSIKYKGD